MPDKKINQCYKYKCIVKTVKYSKKIMHSNLMKCTMKMYYLTTYTFMYTVCFNLMSDMEFMYSLNKVPANEVLNLISKIDMVIQVIYLCECFKL